jgi:hypothetical protein
VFPTHTIAQGEIMARPKTKDWRALENAHKPSGLHVIVSGLVELANDQGPMLKERTGRADQLALELTTGPSNDPDFDGKVWKAATFHKEVKRNQFNSVRVMSGDTVVAQFPVLDDSEHAQLLAKQTAAQNTAMGAKKKASTAEKVVKKAVEAVKEAVGKVAKAVTGGTKNRKTVKKAEAAKKAKAAKKTAKAKTKKAAKKTGKKAKKSKAKKRRR